MTKLIASVLAALTLVACSEAAPTSSPAVGAPVDVDAGTSEQTETSPVNAPCPTTAAPATSEPTGPKKTPSPVEHCEGAYECRPTSDSTPTWFSFDGKDCKFGGYDIFHPDGRVEAFTGQDGRWEGDYTYFSVQTGDEPTIYCKRLPKQ